MTTFQTMEEIQKIIPDIRHDDLMKIAQLIVRAESEAQDRAYEFCRTLYAMNTI